ncbi:MAG TPA: ABC transporter ATP-binding protein [Vicinamibacteria bacterium]|nr:ABC transporter ATP-binding protein [Vicinamibacteria bacterium]
MSAILAVEGLVKTYRGTRKTPPVEAVRGISFEVAPGEFFGLLGPNGAGKSTTLGCITTLVRPTAGRVTVDGIDVMRQPTEAKRRIAVVPQTRNLDRDLTVREVLIFHAAYFGLPKAERESRADRLLAEMQLTEKAGVKPLALSGGLQQRLLIARALMHDPKVLLLDEPTIGLDPQARRLLWETLRRLHDGGLTLIMTTHYMEEADRLCQRLAIIDHGRILQLDTPAALKKALPGGRILDLWVRSPEPIAPRLEALPGVLRVEKVTGTAQADGFERLRLFVDPKDGLLDRALQVVQGAAGDLQHVSLTQPSLEDVYIHLTGKELRE